MANFSFSLRLALGLLPKTEKIENQYNQLVEEYNRLIEFRGSSELKDFLDLEEYLNSPGFKTFKSDMLALNYQNSDDFQKEKQYLALKKDHLIVNYFKVLNSPELKKFNDVLVSDSLARYQELSQYLVSEKHKSIKAQIEHAYQEEAQKKTDYLKLKNSTAFKSFFITRNSALLANYNQLNGSNELVQYEELAAYIQSVGFSKKKKELEANLNEGAAKEKQLKQLKNNKKFINYYKFAQSNDFKQYQEFSESQEWADYQEEAKTLKPKETPAVKAFLKVQNSALLANYNQLNGSNELAQYEELAAYIQSDDFTHKRKEIQSGLNEEIAKEKQFEQLQKNKKFVNYFKFAQSSAFNQYQQFSTSQELTDYQELETHVLAADYAKNLESLKYSNSEEYKLEKEFEKLKNDPNIKFWEKYQISKGYKLYTETESSVPLTEYNTLDELVNSETFKTNKAYLLDKNKFDKTEEARKEKEYGEMKQSENIKWFLSVNKSPKFDSIKAWKMTFEDNFDQPKVDEAKWMNSFFWGKMIMNDRYVMAGDKQYYTDNKNFEINQSVLKIVTKKEKAHGKVWHPLNGFNQQDFDYTSGMLSTAHSFRQLYGRFEAKIKVNPDFPVYQAFWLKGEQIMPQIDVFKFNMDKPGLMQLSVYNKNGDDAKPQKNTSKVSGSALTKDYFIYSIEWSPEKITWKINGIEVFSTSQPIPKEPMYLMLSSGVRKDAKNIEQPAAFEIDWVRCYEKAEN